MGDFFDNQPLLRATLSSFSFDLINQLADGYWHSAYPTDQINLFIQPSTMQIDGGDWTDEGVVTYTVSDTDD